MAQPRKPRRCSTSRLRSCCCCCGGVLHPPTPASCALRPSRLFCVSVCSDELRRKRCAAAPDTVFHPPPTPQGRGVKSAPSHRACWPQCRILVQLLTLCFIMRSDRKWGTARESDKGTNSCFTNLAFCFDTHWRYLPCSLYDCADV